MSAEQTPSPDTVHRVVGPPLYAVFGRHKRRGITQMSVPLTLDEAKQFMKFSKCYMFYTNRRFRRLPNTSVTSSQPSPISPSAQSKAEWDK